MDSHLSVNGVETLSCAETRLKFMHSPPYHNQEIH